MTQTAVSIIALYMQYCHNHNYDDVKNNNNDDCYNSEKKTIVMNAVTL